MSSLPKRNTYYGGNTTANYYNTNNKYLESNDTQHKQKRKHITFGPYFVGSTLGEGEFGKVKLGWTKSPAFSSSSTEVSKQVAIKLIRRDTIKKNSDKEVKIYREINALKHLSHPNIVKLEEVLQNSKYIGIVLEYASGGEFYKYIQKKRRLKEPLACRLFTQLISGVYYMHSKGLVHRDLKLENLLLDKHENLVITDFGFVNEFSQHYELMNTSCGSPCYAAPELVVSTKPYEARKADVWSCGIILYSMLAGYLPWDDDPQNPDGDNITKLYYYITRTPLKFPEYISPIPRDLLRKMLVTDPRRRLGLINIQQHEWLKPHVAFLSITPDDWDINIKVREQSKSIRQKTEKSNKGVSTISTTSVSSNSGKRGSLIMDSSLMASPAPPQASQSHIITKPSSPANDSSPSMKSHMHTRNNSAASAALQAVVGAEREYYIESEQFQISTPTSKSRPYTSPGSGRSHGTAHGLSLYDTDNVIMETSPITFAENHESGNIPDVSHLLSNSVPSNTNICLNNSSYFSNSRYNTISQGDDKFNSHVTDTNEKHSHLSSKHRKPRPTSYHPGTFSTNNSNPLFDYGYTPKSSDSNHRKNSKLNEYMNSESTPSLDLETAMNVKSNDTSPMMLPHRSFSVSKPSLDLKSVSADITKFPDNANMTAKTIHAEYEYSTRKQSNRHSIAMNKENLHTRCDENVSDSQVLPSAQDIYVSGLSYVAGLKDSKACHSFSDKDTDIGDDSVISNNTSDTLEVNRKNNGDKKFNRKRFSILSFYSAYNSSKTSLTSTDSKTTLPAYPSIQPNRFPVQVISSERIPVPESIRLTSMNQSSSARESSRTVLEGADNSNVRERNNANNRTTRTDKRLSSIDTNTKRNTRSHTRGNRASVMISSLGENESDNEIPHPQNQSAAKRVIDFFKRRSMRL